MKKVFILLLFPLSAFAQKDTSFWFAAPDIFEFLGGNPHDRPALLRLTTFSAPADITVSVPANNTFTPLTISIAANATGTIDLSPYLFQLENADANTIADKGILIKSTGLITAYYEITSNCNCNPELFSLKGKNALGIEFIIPSQKEWSIDSTRFNDARSAFNIVATEDNTIIEITPSQPLVGRLNTAAFSITLNRGQTFSSQGLYRSADALLNGSIVKASKPIAITVNEDFLMADGPCADLAGDQLIPTSIWGNEFVVIRGDLTNKDKIVVTALADATSIFIDGNAMAAATINRGSSYEINLSIQPTAYIKANNKVSVYHYTGVNCEIGSAVIPKITCTGSDDVAITRSNNEDAVVFITTKNGNQSFFTVNGDNTIITAADFSPVAGSGGNYVFCKKNLNTSISTGSAARFRNSSGKFQLGFLNGANPFDKTGCRYGFFSDFKSSNVEKSQEEICKGDSVVLKSFGGASYQWSPASGLNDAAAQNPKASPSATTDYKVIITSADGCVDSAFIKVIVNNCVSYNIDSKISGIINDYTPVLAFNPCSNVITVEDATRYNAGDTVLLIQMKGAVIDSSNTANFGTVTNYKNAGNYEFNYVKSKSGNEITLRNVLLKKYDLPDGRVQLIRVPYFKSVSVSDTLTCLPWDGRKGGVLVLNVKDTAELNAPVNVTGRGFRGGTAINSQLFDYQQECGSTAYFTASTNTSRQDKGEGIAEISDAKLSGRGPLASGGGGGNLVNCGGGGGSNAGAGGKGGDQYGQCIKLPADNGGLGGKPMPYSAASNKIFMGGGGGAGDSNDPNGAASFNPDGGNGGGIAIIQANYFDAKSQSVMANGNDGKFCMSNCTEGSGAGGAGGTLLLAVNNFIAAQNNLVLNGGNGASNVSHLAAYGHGPGGGGGGGVLFINKPVLPAVIFTNLSGGQNGVAIIPPAVAWGAVSGNSGQIVFNLSLTVDSVLFKPNIDSVKIKDSFIFCNTADFKALAFTSRDPISKWQWTFGDNTGAVTQNSSHTYNSTGGYTVKLVATDINGCADSTSKLFTINTIALVVSPDTGICKGSTAALRVSGGVSNSYQWHPGTSLNDSTLFNPLASPAATTLYTVTGLTADGCTAKGVVTVALKPSPVLQKSPDTVICKNGTAPLRAQGADSYTWLPAGSLNDAGIPNPVAAPAAATVYYFVGTSNTTQCSSTDSIKVSIKPPAIFAVSPEKTICAKTSVQLSASGGNIYQWSPGRLLNDSLTSNPFTTPFFTTLYTVKIKETVCNDSALLSTSVVVNPLPLLSVKKSNDVDCVFPQAQLTATGSGNFVWSSFTKPMRLSDSLSATPIASPTVSTTYYVKTTDALTLCSNTDSIQVLVVSLKGKPFYVPNAFSPNNDGINKCFRIIAYGAIRDIEISIFNRWGNRVFYTRNPTDCWDGTYKGIPQNAGNYVYYIKAKSDCSQKTLKGNLVLIR